MRYVKCAFGTHYFYTLPIFHAPATTHDSEGQSSPAYIATMYY